MPDVSPSYFIVNADGTIDAVFPGGVKIHGSETDPTGRLNFYSDAALLDLIAYLYAVRVSTNVSTFTIKSGQGDYDTSINMVGVAAAGSPAAAGIEVNAGAFIGGQNRKILDGIGRSSFPQLDDTDGDSNIRIRWGVIDGTTGNKLAGSTGWFPSRTGVGVYRIDWNPAYVDHGAGVVDGAVVALPLTTAAAKVSGSIGTGAFTIIRTWNAAEAATDISIAFIAIGNLQS